jgi:hypothetical protein
MPELPVVLFRLPFVCYHHSCHGPLFGFPINFIRMAIPIHIILHATFISQDSSALRLSQHALHRPANTHLLVENVVVPCWFGL